MSEASGFLQPLLGARFPWLYVESLWWTALGLTGNLMFSSRFLLQWLTSEKQKKIVVPPIFWHLSFWGSLLSLIYSLHIDKLPVILGYAFLPVIYARNLILLRRGGKEAGENAATGG